MDAVPETGPLTVRSIGDFFIFTNCQFVTEIYPLSAVVGHPLA